MKITYEDNTERTEFEAYYKEWRKDVIVEINGNRFRINVITMTRLIQDYEDEIEMKGCFATYPNLVIVKEVTKETIEKTLEYQARKRYFDLLKNHGFDEPLGTDNNG